MSKNRYYYDEFAEEIWDEELQDYPANWQICETLNEQDRTIDQLKQQLAEKDKALDYAIFELDFARNHSQSTTPETFKRIDKLKNKILNQAKETLKSE